MYGGNSWWRRTAASTDGQSERCAQRARSVSPADTWSELTHRDTEKFGREPSKATRRGFDAPARAASCGAGPASCGDVGARGFLPDRRKTLRSEEHTSELQSHLNLVCRLL